MLAKLIDALARGAHARVLAFDVDDWSAREQAALQSALQARSLHPPPVQMQRSIAHMRCLRCFSTVEQCMCWWDDVGRLHVSVEWRSAHVLVE
jgi:hypothetical protein